MVMSSQQIAGMLSQQNSMFGGIASYAQQITPPMGMGPGMGSVPGMGMMSSAYMGPNMGMFNQGPAPIPPPMPVMSSWHPGMMGGMAMPFGPPGAGGPQATAESLVGTGLAAGSSAFQGMGQISSIAGLASAGLGLAGFGGGAAATLGMVSAAPVGLAIGAGAHATQQAYEGFQERTRVNQVLRSRFGNVRGIGEGRGGMGFSSGEMGGISTMLREMGTQDLTTNMEELTRIMDKTAGMGLYKGVQSAREFKQKFQTTVDSLKEISEIMHTTLEGATQFMTQQRGMGFFSGQDISRQLALTRTTSSVTGMSIGQVNELAQQGAQIARATGGRGKAGAQAGVIAGGRLAMAQSMGILSDEDMAFATGGLTGAEATQAMSGRLQQVSQRFMSRGAGRAMVAGLWDPSTGGINQERLNLAMSGGMDIRELLNQGRRSIAQTGGRRSEFFRDEEQLRSQVLAQGGEYLPMAIYGTHLAQKRGLGMEDPIVQRMLRRKFQMGQGEVENVVKMMQNMPQIQAEMITKGRMVRDEEAAGGGGAERGIQGLGKRLGRVWEREVQNKFRQFGDDITTDVTRSIEGIVDAMEGRVTARMSKAGRQLIAERSEFGRAVSGGAKGAAEFGQEDYQRFMQGAGSASFGRDQRMLQKAGMLFGMRPDEYGLGRKMYEQGFQNLGGVLSGESLDQALGQRLGRKVDIFQKRSLGRFIKGSDIALGVRTMMKDTGAEDLWNEISGYDPSRMSRGQRARELGYGGPSEFTPQGRDEMTKFLERAEGQMARDMGYSRDEQKTMGKEFADIMYGTLENTTVFNAWNKNYQKKGFLAVKNVLSKAERLGSPALKAAAAKAKRGSRAEQVAFVEMLEQEGGLTKDMRVTDELTKVMGAYTGDFEADVTGIKSRRAKAMAGLEEATLGARGESVAGFAGGAAAILMGGAGLADKFLGGGFTDKVGALIGGMASDTSVSGEEMTDFLSDPDVREAFIDWQTGTKGEKDAARGRLHKLYQNMDEGRKNTWNRLKNLNTSSNKKGKAALLNIAESFQAEDYRGQIEVQNDMGRELSKALEGASVSSMGAEGREAFRTLQEVAKLRSSQDPDDIARSYKLESGLMDKIVGTQASKDVMKALEGTEGGEFIRAGLVGAEGAFSQFGGGKGRKGRARETDVKNIMRVMLGTEGLSLSDTSVREAFGKGVDADDIVKKIAKGGKSAEGAIEKILGAYKGAGLEEGKLSRLRERLTGGGGVTEALSDANLTDEERRKLAAGIGGGYAGAARARAKAEKTATEDGQKVANKHLLSISQAVTLMASGQKVSLDPEDLKSLVKAVKEGGKPTARTG